MATVQEMFAFVANFGPMLGQLAAQVQYLEQRVEALESGGVHQVAGDEAPEADGAIEIPGFGKIDPEAMLKAGMPSGGMASIMERLTSWRPAAAPPAPAAPAAPAPAAPSSGTPSP